MKHSYPKYRKHRDCSYSKSSKIVSQLGIETVKEILTKHGQYIAAQKLSDLCGWKVSPYVTYYLRKFVLKMEAFANEKSAIKSKAL